VRDAKNMHDEPALMAEVQTTPLMMEGTTEIPPRTKAMTKGDCAAVPVEIERSGSSNLLCCFNGVSNDSLDCPRNSELSQSWKTDTIMPTMRMLKK